MGEKSYIVLGAGVVGLTTALELQKRCPDSIITIVAEHVPGDKTIEYCSPWAGANWLSAASDDGRQELWDAITFCEFERLSTSHPECGIAQMKIKAIFDNPPEKAGILSQQTGKLWYKELVKGFRELQSEELPKGATYGFEAGTFMVNVQKYLPWLQVEVLKAGISIRRAKYSSIHELISDYPYANAYFNCSGLGSYSLKGVKDINLYPSRGQVVLVETPKTLPPSLQKMHFRSPRRTDSDTTYIFPRPDCGGIVLGGCRIDKEWNGSIDLEFEEDIMRRCVDLCPDLGNIKELKVLGHGVGLRPNRKGGARIEVEQFGTAKVIHNYGAGGTGYQASWGMANDAVNLLLASEAELEKQESSVGWKAKL